ncbi:MAG: protein translocase SEC61 complex subunit gamma [Candidatus Woesearchaeota archaeon]
MEETNQKPSLWFKLKRFIIECKRVLKITKKPDKIEFKTIVKVTGAGILIIGAMGFVIYLINQLIRGGI